MAVECTLAPFINEEFLVTGAWGEQRPGHIHAGIDLQTRKAYQTDVGQPVYSMSNGQVVRVDQTDQGTGYGALCIVWDLVTKDMWLYGDLGDNSVQVSVGDIIQMGTQIGVEGDPSGTASSGLHVHVEKENRPDGVFQFGYINSIDPTTGTGITNAVDGTIYIYYGIIPPQPEKKKKGFPWPIYIKKLRQKRRGIL